MEFWMLVPGVRMVVLGGQLVRVVWQVTLFQASAV